MTKAKLYLAPKDTPPPAGEPADPWVQVDVISETAYIGSDGRMHEFGTFPTRYSKEVLRHRVQQHVDLITGRKK